MLINVEIALAYICIRDILISQPWRSRQGTKWKLGHYVTRLKAVVPSQIFEKFSDKREKKWQMLIEYESREWLAMIKLR